MQTNYINYETVIATSRWQRSTFLNKWWSIYADDSRWAPAAHSTLRRELEPAANSHLARMQPLMVHLEALPHRTHASSAQYGQPRKFSPTVSTSSWGALTKTPLAAAVVLLDQRRSDGAGYLAMLHCANVPEALDRLLWDLAEALRSYGCRRLLGPTALSPYLHAGALQNCWNMTPPVHTPYNPPYVPEIFSQTGRTLDQEARLFHLSVENVSERNGPAELVAFESMRLTDDLLPLLQAGCHSCAGAPLPDVDEAEFLVRWLQRWPIHGWLAHIDGRPVGFVLLQPDRAPALRRAKGGHTLLWRIWLRVWGERRPAESGRLLYWSVLPEWRGRGIGRQLLRKALHVAHEQGWQTLTVGLVPTMAGTAHNLLESYGAIPRQSYTLYEWTL